MSPVYPSLPVVLFQLAAVLARGELPDPLDIEVRVRGGEVRVLLVLDTADEVRAWARRCGDAAQQIRETPVDIDGVPHTITTAYGHFAGARIHVTATTAHIDSSGGTP